MPLNYAASDTSGFFQGGGAMGALMRAHDWAASPIGPPQEWSQPLRTLVSVMLTANQPMFLAWGAERTMLYNDPYSEILADKHPAALGRNFLEVWSEARADLEPIVADAYAGRPTSMNDIELRLTRNGRPEEAHFSFSYTPVRDEAGAVAGFFCPCVETTEQVVAERRRLEDTRRQRRLFEQVPGFIAVLHGPDHRFEFANAAYRRLMGERDYIGRTVREALPELEGQDFFELLDRVYAQGERFVADRVPILLDRPGASSEERVLDFVYEPIADEAGRVTGIFVEGHDVTDAHRAETGLRESETRFRDMADNAPAMIWVTDPSGYCTYLNARWYEYTGQIPGAGEAYGWLDAVHPDDRSIAEAAFMSANAERRNYRVEFRVRRADGAYRWSIDAAAARFGGDGAYLGYVGSIIDIDERRETEERLALSEERLRLALDVAEVGEWEVDGGDGTLHWPARVKAMFGISPDVPVTMTDFYDGVHPDDREKTGAAYDAAADPDRRALYDVDYRTVGKEDGVVRWVAAKGRGIFDATGRCVRVIGTAVDVTERKRAEEALRDLNDTLEQRVAERTADLVAAQDALRQAQKMEAVGQLTGGLAHDFNNLLTGISGSLEMMGIRIAQGRMADVERYVAAAQGAAKRAAALTHRLLAFSRRQTLAPKPTDVKQLVAGMEELIRRTVGPAVTVETVNAAGLWPSLIDPSQLENAVLNLCINARDAMPDGGRITIETANRWMDQRTAAERGLEPGQYISLCVSDTGTGMTPEVIASAFDPFFTTKPIGKGTGLGLSMIYGFAKQSGGSVAIYSEVGQGTMVCVYLPRHLGEPDEVGDAHAPEEAPRAAAGETVLVVDDEPTVRMLVAEVLTDLGYTAIEAADGAAGLKVVNSDARIDLLVTDVGLPGGMNGRQVAEAARAVRPGLKVLFITGYAENAVLSHGHLDAGMHILTKPFAMDALAGRIRDLIEG